jgi:hypothetical protein
MSVSSTSQTVQQAAHKVLFTEVPKTYSKAAKKRPSEATTETADDASVSAEKKRAIQPIPNENQRLFKEYSIDTPWSCGQSLEELTNLLFGSAIDMPRRMIDYFFMLDTVLVTNAKNVSPDIPLMFESISDPATEFKTKKDVLSACVDRHMHDRDPLVSRNQIAVFIALMTFAHFRNLTAFLRVVFVSSPVDFCRTFYSVKWADEDVVVYAHLFRAVSIDMESMREMRLGMLDDSEVHEVYKSFFVGAAMCASEVGVRELLSTQRGATSAFVARSITMFGSDAWNAREKKRGIVSLDEIIATAYPPNSVLGNTEQRPPFLFVKSNMASIVPMRDVGLAVQKHMANLAEAPRTDEDKSLVWKWVDAYENNVHVGVAKIGSLTQLAIKSGKTSLVNRMFSREDVRRSFMLGTMLGYVSRQVESPDTDEGEKLVWCATLRNYLSNGDFKDEPHRGGRIMLIASIARDDELFVMGADLCAQVSLLGARDIIISIVRKRQLRMFERLIKMPNLDFKQVYKAFLSQLASTEKDAKTFFNLALQHQSAWFLLNHEQARTILNKQSQTTPLLVSLTLFVANKATPDSDVQKQLIGYMQRTCETNGVNEQPNNISLCCYCADKPPKVLLRRCTHLVSCEDCWPAVRVKGMDQCPVCRAEIDKTDADWYIVAK